MPAEASRPAESPSLDAKLALPDSETESYDEVPKINTGDQDDGRAGPNPGIQDEGQAGPNLGVQYEGQAGSNPGDVAGSQPQSSHVENLKLPSEDPVILEEPASSTETLSSLQKLEKELSFADQFFVEKQQEEEPRKTNAEAEVQSMVSVPIHQNTSSVPPMTTLIIDLTTSHSGSPLPTSSTTTLTVKKTNIPPPPQLQQSTADPTLMKRIDELEQHMANLLQYNLALEERLDKHGSWLYKLENLNIPYQVSKAVDKIVTDAVDWAMQAPLRARFSNLPTVDMKEILQQRMFKSKSYEAHEDHKKLYDALEKSLECDYSDQLLSDLKEARQKKRKRRDVPKTPSGSPTPQPPPPPPPAGASGAPYLEYLRHGSKGSSPALSISTMKATSYPNFDFELLMPEQIWIEDVCTYDISAKYGISHWWFNRQKFYIDRHDSSLHHKEVRSHMRILSVVRIKAYSRYGVDLQEYMIAEKDFKNLHPTDFEDLNLLLLHGYKFKHDYTIIESPRAVMFPVNNNERKIMRFNEIYNFCDGTLTRILEALAYRIKEFKIKRLNPGMNTRFWTQKGVTRSKEFIVAIERRLRDNPLVSVEVLRYDYKRSNVRTRE
nr:hypothetical protein [Tanacetum cinerariifolium]